MTEHTRCLILVLRCPFHQYKTIPYEWYPCVQKSANNSKWVSLASFTLLHKAILVNSWDFVSVVLVLIFTSLDNINKLHYSLVSLQGVTTGCILPLLYCYLEFKHRSLKNPKLFSISVKVIFEPSVLRRKGTGVSSF